MGITGPSGGDDQACRGRWARQRGQSTAAESNCIAMRQTQPAIPSAASAIDLYCAVSVEREECERGLVDRHESQPSVTVFTVAAMSHHR